MNKFSGKASLMATLVAAWVGASSAQAAEIKIGVVLPLSGALSGYGQPSQKGLDIIQSITPTLKNGDTVKLIVIDDKSDKVEAANAMQRLVSSDKVDAVIGEELPRLKTFFRKPVIANISGFSVEEYAYCCERIDKEEQVGLIEVNVSCPNVRHGGMSFGTSPEAAAEVTRVRVRREGRTVIPCCERLIDSISLLVTTF